MFFDKLKQSRLKEPVPEITLTQKMRIKKQKAKADKQPTYIGKPCLVCGNTKRIVINNNCTKCVNKRQRELYHARRIFE
jgi:queuine/archaeosine tRNA-ribosyltransferase